MYPEHVAFYWDFAHLAVGNPRISNQEHRNPSVKGWIFQNDSPGRKHAFYLIIFLKAPKNVGDHKTGIFSTIIHISSSSNLLMVFSMIRLYILLSEDMCFLSISLFLFPIPSVNAEPYLIFPLPIISPFCLLYQSLSWWKLTLVIKRQQVSGDN